jgi:hypothetical protein
LADRYLCRQTVANGINGRANDRKKLGIYEHLSANNDKDSMLLGVSSRRPGNPIKLASPQSST